jgi:hypothetical protein
VHEIEHSDSRPQLNRCPGAFSFQEQSMPIVRVSHFWTDREMHLFVDKIYTLPNSDAAKRGYATFEEVFGPPKAPAVPHTDDNHAAAAEQRAAF